MLHIVLYQPEIPPNTGNIIRLAANMGATLHLVHPLGFELSEKRVRRAGLDYHESARVHEYADFPSLVETSGIKRLYACTTKANVNHSTPRYRQGDGFVFGPESRGLPEHIYRSTLMTEAIRIPMNENQRSLNLSNATAIVLYEAWRQLRFKPL